MKNKNIYILAYLFLFQFSFVPDKLYFIEEERTFENYLLLNDPVLHNFNDSCHLKDSFFSMNPVLSLKNSNIIAVDLEKRIEETILISFLIRNYSTIKDKSYDLYELSEYILDESESNGLDPLFVLAIIQTESSYVNSSVSPKGAMGLMQLLPFVARNIAREKDIKWTSNYVLYNPFLNIKMGIYFYKQLEEQFNFNKFIALAAYNQGPSKIRQLMKEGSHIPRMYSLKVLKTYNNFKNFI